MTFPVLKLSLTTSPTHELFRTIIIRVLSGSKLIRFVFKQDWLFFSFILNIFLFYSNFRHCRVFVCFLSNGLTRNDSHFSKTPRELVQAKDRRNSLGRKLLSGRSHSIALCEVFVAPSPSLLPFRRRRRPKKKILRCVRFNRNFVHHFSGIIIGPV